MNVPWTRDITINHSCSGQNIGFLERPILQTAAGVCVHHTSTVMFLGKLIIKSWLSTGVQQ